MNVYLNNHPVKIVLIVKLNLLDIFVKFVIYLIMIFNKNKFIIVINAEFVELGDKIIDFIVKHVNVVIKLN